MQQGKASPGSGDVLVLVNGATPQFLRLAETAVLAALRHLGAPLHVHDVALGLGQALAQPAACIVIGSPGALARLSSLEREALLACVHAGTGLVNFDGDSPLPQFCPEAGAWQPVARVVASAARHYCLATREPGDTVALSSPLSAPRLSLPPGCQALLEDGEGRPLLVAGEHGTGRIVQWGLPLKLWTFEHLGHGCGLDDLFWRSLVWAARKPFALLALPPFVTARVDDASGSGSTFHCGPEGAAHQLRYVDSLHRYGFRPNVGLFIRDIPDQDHPALRRLAQSGEAEFSPHAFTEINDHPEHLIYLTHDGREYTPAELERNFAEVDEAFHRFGLRQAPTLNCHYYEMGEAALPYLWERGVRYLMTETRAGTTYADPRARDWFPPPYGHFGYLLGPLVDHERFFDCLSQYNGPRGQHAGAADALHPHTTFAREAAQNDPAAIGRKAAAMVARGLDNMFFGVLMTHEQRIASLTLEQWEQALKLAQAGLGRYQAIPVRYSEVCRYAERRQRIRLEGVRVETGALRCRFAARERANLLLSVFTGEQEITRHLLPVRVEGEGWVRVDLPRA